MDESAGTFVLEVGGASIELVVEAMQKGARDFVEKPWENARVLAVVATLAVAVAFRPLRGS
mgnify:CR=1 FL=1